MITEIEVEGFKSLEKVRLKLGGLNLFVGANASGKSNFFDALRVLQGIGYGFSVGEIFNGKPKGATSEVWDGIRGGSSMAHFMSPTSGDRAESQIVFRTCLKSPSSHHPFVYSIGFSADRGSIEFESSSLGSRSLFNISAETSEWSDFWELRERQKKGRPALAGNLHAFGPAEDERQAYVKILSNMQRLTLSSAILRGYGQIFLADRMGESGENFASLVKSILKDPKKKTAYLSWLRQLIPHEAEDVKTLPGALGEPLFALEKGGLEFPAPILSDGTLRFAALTAAFFQPDMPDILTIEEIENGIHPSRLRLLVELLKTQSGAEGPQVFATTHSPVVLAWLDESDYETTFFCRRDEETGASIIKPLSEIPRLVELVKKQPLSELFAEGWMEASF